MLEVGMLLSVRLKDCQPIRVLNKLDFRVQFVVFDAFTGHRDKFGISPEQAWPRRKGHRGCIDEQRLTIKL